MKKETAGEVLGHPLWMLPMMLIIFLGGIETIHTLAHIHGEIDVHGICRRNKEYIQSLESEDDY